MENNNDLRKLGLEIWAWRASQQPNSGDDIPRLPRSGGGVSAGPDYGNPFANSGIMGSGRIQNRFTPGNTFSGYRKGG